MCGQMFSLQLIFHYYNVVRFIFDVKMATLDMVFRRSVEKEDYGKCL